MSKSKENVAVLEQFSVLMDELLRSGLKRATFQPWEIDILLEVEACGLSAVSKRKALQEYQNAVQAEMEQGAPLPMRFSAFLAARNRN